MLFQCPMPHAPCPMPNSQCPIPNVFDLALRINTQLCLWYDENAETIGECRT
ncbi:MAG: hypothetical protein ACRAVC_10480 [Trichormus sp.]